MHHTYLKQISTVRQLVTRNKNIVNNYRMIIVRLFIEMPFNANIVLV